MANSNQGFDLITVGHQPDPSLNKDFDGLDLADLKVSSNILNIV